ncbi:MAG: hypothetical protein J6I89_05100 [Oscillospiraceae bacterium]|nr:hypothetical protein [Oscillospiraceae bacterium]
MELNLEGRVFRRVNNPAVHVLLTGWAGFMFCGALQGITDNFTELPLIHWGDSPEGIFGIVFVLFWFVFVGGFVWAGVSGLLSVRIGRSGVAMKLWFIPIRELDATEIKTVVKVFQRDTSRLVLLTDTAEELREKSRSFADKRKLRHHDLRMRDHTRVSDDMVKRYVARSLHKNRFWMDWSGELEQELRKNLTTTIFIV